MKVTAGADSAARRCLVLQTMLWTRQRPATRQGGPNCCTSLHRFLVEICLHTVCTAVFLAHDLHRVSFPLLPNNAHLMLAIIEYFCYRVGNENTKRGKRGKW